jgi:uncharacterized protein (DUF697 family)
MSKEVSKAETDRVINHHIWASMATGLIPIPGADLAGLLGVQLNMIKSLTDMYEVPFMEEAVKKMLFSLGGLFLLSKTAPLLGSLIKLIPVIGQGVGSVGMPVICGASTYATGKVFIRHFELGGDLHNFEPEKAKDYYAEMFEEGQKIAPELKKNGGKI